MIAVPMATAAADGGPRSCTWAMKTDWAVCWSFDKRKAGRLVYRPDFWVQRWDRQQDEPIGWQRVESEGDWQQCSMGVARFNERTGCKSARPKPQIEVESRPRDRLGWAVDWNQQTKPQLLQQLAKQIATPATRSKGDCANASKKHHKFHTRRRGGYDVARVRNLSQKPMGVQNKCVGRWELKSCIPRRSGRSGSAEGAAWRGGSGSERGTCARLSLRESIIRNHHIRLRA